MDAEDDLLISDSLNHRVQKFSREGEFLDTRGRAGGGDGELNMPWGLALDWDGNVYVADWRNDRVQKFDAGGGFLAKWGGPGSGLFNRPAAVAVDEEGLLYVADWGNERVQILTPEGEVLGTIRGDSLDSRWAADYFAANPEEGAARYAADLAPEIDAVGGAGPGGVGQRGEAVVGADGGEVGQGGADLHRGQLPAPATGIPEGAERVVGHVGG